MRSNPGEGEAAEWSTKDFPGENGVGATTPATATRCERALWHELRAKRLDGWIFVVKLGSDPISRTSRALRPSWSWRPMVRSTRRRRGGERISVGDAWFEGAGFRILHFSDEEILSDLGEVLDRIRGVLWPASPSPGLLRNPSPSRGGPSSSAPDKILVIACGALAREVREVLEANRLDHIELTCLPAQWHNRPEKIAPGVRKIIRENRGRYARIAVAYAECGTQGALDKVCAEEGVDPHRRPALLRLLFGHGKLPRGGRCRHGFVLPDRFPRPPVRGFVIEPLGLDRHPELRDMYFGNYRRVVYLAQSEDDELDAKARAAAEGSGSPMRSGSPASAT